MSEDYNEIVPVPLEPIEQEKTERKFHENNNDYIAGFWMRFWAYLLDLIMIASINRMIIKPSFRGLDLSLHNSGMFTPFAIATAAVFYLYFVLFTKFTGQTIGKMVFGLKVVSIKNDQLTWGSILFREGIGRYISTTIWILYIIIAFTPKKQGIHDLFADTTVIHEQISKKLEPAL